jgi:hypothetical protein
MEARCKGLLVAVFGIATLFAANSFAGQARSTNFVVTAPTPEIAKQIAKEAELFRYKLALEWLGKPLPNWKSPCIVNVQVGQIGAGGMTTFIFDRVGGVSDFKMNIQGPLDRILDSVLPHEINHTIFAEHFRRPLPRWADEGAATFVEDESERRRQMLVAMDVLKTARRIPLRSLLSIMDYPKEMRDVLNLYAEGYVLTELLIQSGGRAHFLNFLQTAHTEGWDRAIHTYYGKAGIAALDQEWNQWVIAGCPAKPGPSDTVLASAEQPGSSKNGQLMARSQAPDREPVTAIDVAQGQTQFASNAAFENSPRGTELQAPPPAGRTTSGFSEPAMLSQVDLGAEMVFIPPQNRAAPAKKQVAREELASATPRRRAPEADESDETTEQDVEEYQDDRKTRILASPRERPVQTVAAAIRRNTLATPVLRLESRTQLGKSRAMSIEDL